MSTASWNGARERNAARPAAPPGWLPTLAAGWKAYAGYASRYQSLVLLSAIYYLVLGPSVLLARLVGTRLLDLDRRPRASYWIERAAENGHVFAMRKLVDIYLEGGYGQPADLAKAEAWATRHRAARDSR